MSSIAISAVVRPSRILLLATLGMCLGMLACGVLAGTGWIGSFSSQGKLFIAGLSISSSLYAFISHVKSRKSLRIDISGIGQIRLMEHTDVAQAFAGQLDAGKHGGVEFQLTEGSVLWPNLLFLHLESGQGHKETLRILTDSVSRDEFRALHIACRWIAARNGTKGTEGTEGSESGNAI